MHSLRRQVLLLFFKSFDMVAVLLSCVISIQEDCFFSGQSPFLFGQIPILFQDTRMLMGVTGGAVFLHFIYLMFGFYRSKRLAPPYQEYIDILKANTLGVLIFYAVLSRTTPLRTLIIFWIISTGILIISRVLMRFFLIYMRTRGRNLRFIVIVGTNKKAVNLANRLKTRKFGYSIVGFVDDDWHGIDNVEKAGLKVVADFKEFPDFIRLNVVDEVVILLPMQSFYSQILKIVDVCELHGVKTRFFPILSELRLEKVRTEFFQGEVMITLSSERMHGWRIVAKRIIDLTIASAGIIFLLPFFAVIALSIKLSSPGPVFFVQERIGLNKRRFKLFKFRTMMQDAEQKMSDMEKYNEVSGPAFKMKNDPRVTLVGKILRKTSIDELPQLLNVIKGEMSLVGPRPLPVRDYERFEKDWHRRRFSVQPGLTCLWQVQGRSNLHFDQWMRLDMKYIDHWSLQLDFIILLKTIPAVFRAVGAL